MNNMIIKFNGQEFAIMVFFGNYSNHFNYFDQLLNIRERKKKKLYMYKLNDEKFRIFFSSAHSAPVKV